MRHLSDGFHHIQSESYFSEGRRSFELTTTTISCPSRHVAQCTGGSLRRVSGTLSAGAVRRAAIRNKFLSVDRRRYTTAPSTMKQHYLSMTVVGVTAIFLTLLLLYQMSYKFNASVRRPDHIRLLPGVLDCPVPGLRNIEQYRKYLHNTETTCNNMRQFGGKPPAPGDGKKFVCMDDRFNIKPGNCLVFSFGVNNEWSFEDEFDKFGCKVYAYDPTMGKEDHQRSPNVRFFATGIANYKGTKKIGMGNNWTMRKVDRFENLVREAGQEGREIDYVKLDVELSEIDFLQDMLFNSPQVLARIKQIAMEVHDGFFKDDLSQTSRQQVFWTYFMMMRCAGFRLIQSRNAGAWREVVWVKEL